MTLSLSTSCALLALAASVIALPTQESCENVTCPGPVSYYASLGCEPVYENEGDCCAVEYNCTHLYERAKNKCYVNDHEYDVGESLRDEDANPCDIGCKCRVDHQGYASFTCAVVDCFFGPAQSGCWRKRSPDKCCPGEQVCPSDEKRAECIVDGKTYLDGEYFEVPSDPDLNCICQPGYKGENVEPFCMKPRHAYCSPDFRNARDLYENCAPVYYSSQSLMTSCSVFSRCPQPEDQIVRNNSDEGRSNEEGVTCTYGNMTLNAGDELNIIDCVLCKCEVGPSLSCSRLNDDDCKKHQ